MASPSQEQLQGACPNPVRAPETPTPEDLQATDHTPDPRAPTSRATSNFTKKRHLVAGTLVASKAMWTKLGNAFYGTWNHLSKDSPVIGNIFEKVK